MRKSINFRLLNIVAGITLAALTCPSWASVFFGLCALVAWSDKPKEESHGAG